MISSPYHLKTFVPPLNLCLLSGGMYIGGLPENMNLTYLPYSIQDNPSFLGCVKALIVNDVIQDLLQAGNGKSGKSYVILNSFMCSHACRSLSFTLVCNVF